MRRDPAVIPTRGVFFLHDDRAGESPPHKNKTSSALGAEEEVPGKAAEPEEEDTGIGRWRADDEVQVGQKSRNGDERRR